MHSAFMKIYPYVIYTGKGWYKYAEAGAKAPMDDPWVEKAIETYSVKEGLERRRISDQVSENKTKNVKSS